MPRTRSFDEDALLDAAIELFWVHGYKSASLADLTAATGVTNGSLYQAYGNKWGLFLVAYQRYCDRRVVVVENVFLREKADVEHTANALFDAIIDDCISYPDRRGCLMLNSISELGTRDEVARISAKTVAAMEASVARALSVVAPKGVDAEQVAATAAHVVALSQALIQLARMGRDVGELRRIGSVAATSTQHQLMAA